MNKPIRVLHVIGSMNRGGAENMIMNLYRNIDRTRVQFDFVENTFQEAAFDDEIRSLGGRIFNCPHYNGLNHIAYVKWWKRFFDEHAREFVAVHGHLGSTAALYLPIAKRYGLYAIAHSHNIHGKNFIDYLYRIYSYPTRYIADWFFACSQEAGVSRYGNKVASDPSRYFVLNNAIDTKKFGFSRQVRDDMRKKLNISDPEIVIGHVGRFVEQKNHPFLIDIFAEILKRNKNVKLLLLGKEDAEQIIRGKVQSLGLNDHVIFAGVQSDTAPYYQAMDVFVFPSLYEGLGIVLVEAQAAGLPCVISDKVPLESIMTEGLVSVCKLTDSPARWAECSLKQVGSERMDHSYDIAANGYEIRETANWLADFYCSKADR